MRATRGRHTTTPKVAISDLINVTSEEEDTESLDYGLSKDFHEFYQLEEDSVVGQGATAVVHTARCLVTGEIFAVKKIQKRQSEAESGLKTPLQLKTNTLREIEVLKRLKGSLSVVNFQAAFEDHDNVYIVLEKCSGGELYHQIGQVPYTEAEVAKIMRAVFKTLRQCHKAHVVHRDIKPGNFMLRDAPSEDGEAGEEGSRRVYKCIDFGLATYFEKHGKQSNAQIESLSGTPWYMSPEMLSSRVGPECDLWAAGVMMYQLLSGRFPFNDHSNPMKPLLSKICYSILKDDVKFRGSAWEGVSDEAKDLITKLLTKNPADRMSAKEALQHPWIRPEGTPGLGRRKRKIQDKIVQRLQQFSSQPVFHQTVLQILAQEVQDRLKVATEGQGPEVVASVCPMDAPDCMNLRGDLQDINSLFTELDHDNNEHVSANNLHMKLTENNKFAILPLEARQLIPPHYPRTGRISRLEFTAAFLDPQTIESALSEDEFTGLGRQVFDRLDGDGDGCLQREDVSRWLKDSGRVKDDDIPAAVREVFRSAGMEQDDGKDVETGCVCAIDFATFMELMFEAHITDTDDVFEDRLLCQEDDDVMLLQ